MSEYIDIGAQFGDDPLVVVLHTNLRLTDEVAEQYASPDALEEGSPLAQALAFVPGIAALHLDGGTLTITRDPDEEWHAIIADVSAALKEFFL